MGRESALAGDEQSQPAGWLHIRRGLGLRQTGPHPRILRPASRVVQRFSRSEDARTGVRNNYTSSPSLAALVARISTSPPCAQDSMSTSGPPVTAFPRIWAASAWTWTASLSRGSEERRVGK